MASPQISGLSSGINWNLIVNDIVTADSAGMNQVKAQQTKVNTQISALGSLSTDLTSLSASVFALEDPSLYDGALASSTTSGSTWQMTAQNGTPFGSYTIAVSRLATASQLQGASGISSPLSAGDDVSGLTLAAAPTAQAITAGTFTVNGKQITVTTSESLQDVFAAIATATGGAVTGGYSSSTDKVTLSSSAPIVLGAANDSSNFLQALKLFNGTNTGTITSTTNLGTAQLADPVSSADLKAALTGQDGSGNGAFTINGVSIGYNVNTDSLGTVLARINNSGAGVTASYDANADRILLTNSVTGSSGISVSDTSGNLMAALGLGGGTLVQGQDAQFSVNGGPTQTSASNTLTSNALGVSGLSVTVDSQTTQTIQVAMNTQAISSAIGTFITAFNTFQSDVGNDTTVNVVNGTISGSVLSSNHDVADWATTLQGKAFSAGSGLSGVINSLDDLGIDFSGTSGQLTLTDESKLTSALSGNPKAVAAFFQTATTGFGSIMNNAINDIISQNSSTQQTLQSESRDLGDQISSMQTQLDATQAQLEAEFQAMEAFFTKYQSDSSALASFGSSTGGSSTSSALGNITSGVNNSTGSSSSSTSSSSSSTTG
ncbi:MAG TPA: flagellar filament capping protein FliD [Opitutaceae bacterium]|nr:flagellar filament capping protein FliD [Opitutaceae bacterium]